MAENALTTRFSANIFKLKVTTVNSAPDEGCTDSSWYGQLGGFVFSRTIP